MLLSDVCLTSVAYIGPKSRTDRPRKTKIGTEVAHVTRDSDTTFRIKRSPVRSGYLFKSLHDLYGRHHDHSLSIMNIHGARRAGCRRRNKACRLWTTWAAACVQRAGRGILCRHAHSLLVVACERQLYINRIRVTCMNCNPVPLKL